MLKESNENSAHFNDSEFIENGSFEIGCMTILTSSIIILQGD